MNQFGKSAAATTISIVGIVMACAGCHPVLGVAAGMVAIPTVSNLWRLASMEAPAILVDDDGRMAEAWGGSAMAVVCGSISVVGHPVAGCAMLIGATAVMFAVEKWQASRA